MEGILAALLPEPAMQPATDVVRVDAVEAEAKLTPDGVVRWTDVGAGRERSFDVEREVLGVEVEGRKVCVRAFVEDGGGGCWSGSRSRVRRDLELEFTAGGEAAAWAQRLEEYIRTLGRPKRVFILLNPFGGEKFARKIFNDEVRPLLAAAGIDYTLRETEHRSHAQNLTRELDLSGYDGIVCVSGDGTLVEVLNGLLQRKDWAEAIRKPLGIIPAGSGNGMIKSLLHSAGEAFSVSNAVFSLIRGHRRDLDVATVSQGQTLFFSILMLCWGLVADIDIESEKYRWMGSARFEIYPLLRILKLRKYNGTVSFVPAPGYEGHGEPMDQSMFNGFSHESNIIPNQYCGYTGCRADYHIRDWRFIEGPFISVWLHNVPWANTSAMAAPDAEFCDGFYDLIVVKDCPKIALLSFLLKLKDGSHVNSPYVLYLKVRALRLDPRQRVGDAGNGGIIDCNGEVLARGTGTHQSGGIQDDPMAYGPISVHVESGLATVFSPQ